ncbi:MAG: hypothetical protein AAF716_16450 [Cyanobacteria bacterium P01_D01_bin.1]
MAIAPAAQSGTAYQGPGSEGIGTWPYDIVASDGRSVLEVYDGCTTFTLLTEQDRFDYYFTRHYLNNRDTSQGEMRNAGQSSWRQVTFPSYTYVVVRGDGTRLGTKQF